LSGFVKKILTSPVFLAFWSSEPAPDMGILSSGKKKSVSTPGSAGTAGAIKPEAVSFAESSKPSSEEDAAAKIQAIRRGKETRAKVSEEKKISQMKEDREKAAVKLQAIQKGKAARKQVSVMASAGPSLSERLSACLSSFVEAYQKCAAASVSEEAAATVAETKSVGEKLPEALRAKVEMLFKKMDIDGDGMIQEAEAIAFFKKFAKLNARAMLNEERRRHLLMLNPTHARAHPSPRHVRWGGTLMCAGLQTADLPFPFSPGGHRPQRRGNARGDVRLLVQRDDYRHTSRTRTWGVDAPARIEPLSADGKEWATPSLA
jgi:gas vesicle protein